MMLLIKLIQAQGRGQQQGRGFGHPVPDLGGLVGKPLAQAFVDMVDQGVAKLVGGGAGRQMGGSAVFGLVGSEIGGHIEKEGLLAYGIGVFRAGCLCCAQGVQIGQVGLMPMP